MQTLIQYEFVLVIKILMIIDYTTIKKIVVIGRYLQFGSLQVDSCYSRE